ncbi:hypothetical protein IO401_001331 [Campylobacter lari]|nr:hypothetical protein [Campylobacter lari]EGK8085079.1 hypothetical protein [Campylobacter lari]EJV5920101.1 hypothetical protein [Campylobacter lari]
MEAFPIWHDKYSIENADIDLQHQTLFILVDKTAKLLNRHIYKTEVKELLSDFLIICERILKMKKIICIQ